MTSLSPFLEHLQTTFFNRPYVFGFLGAFLILATLQLGIRRMFLFLGLGWVIAFASEASSIRNGFPYGDYQYVYENMKGEFILWGVPLWDCLSYTFIAYASFSTATFFFYPSSKLLSTEEFLKLRTSRKVLFLSTLLMAGIDVVIDPLALRGDRWFLGNIYYYPNGGSYFGVPISNFLGWGLVAFCIVAVFQPCDRWLHRIGKPVSPLQWRGIKRFLGFGLYTGIYLFNLTLTAWIQEWVLVGLDLALYTPLAIAARKSMAKSFVYKKI